MWCICFKPRDRFTKYVEEWEREIEDIVINIRQARKLGKICMSNRLLGRQDIRMEKDILELIRKIDSDIVSTKRKAIQFLTDSSSLYDQRNQQLEFYQSYIKKQIHILKMRKEILELKENYKMLSEENELLKQQNSTVLEYLQQQRESKKLHRGSKDYPNIEANKDYEYLLKMYGQPFFKNPEFLQAQELSKRQLKNILGKYDKMIKSLEQKVSECKNEQSQIKRDNETFQEEEEEGISEPSAEQGHSEDQEVLSEMSFWLEQELENRKLLQIQANLGELLYDDYQDNFKQRNFGNRLKISFSRTRSERFGKPKDDLKQPILDSKDDQPSRSKTTYSKTERLKSVTKTEREEVELIDMGCSSRNGQTSSGKSKA